MNDTAKAEAVLGNLVTALQMLGNCPEFTYLIPEVRVNLAYALREAQTPEDVAAVEGRITAVRGRPHAAGIPGWGASDHLARRLLEVRKYDPGINAVINFKYDQEIIEVVQQYCMEKGLLLGAVDRTEEPEEVAVRDGSSMPWKVKQLFKKYGVMPRLFHEGAGWGKEPLLLALGESAVEVTKIAIDIARRYSEKINR